MTPHPCHPALCPRRRRLPAQGFTLIELLVAISIVVILLFMINKLFKDTADAVSLGIGLSDIISNSRAVAEQIARDGDAMIGPGTAGGFLVIINHTYNGVLVPRTAGGEQQQDVQSDQLAFIRSISAGNPDPIAPGNSNSYTNTNGAGNARVWYGHGERLNPNGSTSGALGGSGASNYNILASNWILCRQAMFLDGSTTPAAVHATGLDASSDVVGVSGAVGGNQVYNALTDICKLSLAQITGAPPDPGAPPPYNLDAMIDHNNDNYRRTALGFAFAGTRLRVNPTPASPYDSWRIAQAHPYLAGHVSDFVVEFAADTNNDGVLDPHPAGSDRGLAWYGGSLLPASYNWGSNAEPPLITGYSAIASRAHVWQHNDSKAFSTSGNADNSKWPYLIRIRWRMHDLRGRLGAPDYDAGGNAVVRSGRWFEQIIKVNRPE